ncbi:hypothetical protein QAD02_001779 [Eretmocerus hayati]|uniref:Uncharacterized protein n=1 Tax=Eretmocerus hayati TaxID=131215 RepID=A0ACC2NH88_9HYME|nr:hypothetical protein QAD02_001779 [Eretmocerus hayati]
MILLLRYVKQQDLRPECMVSAAYKQQRKQPQVFSINHQSEDPVVRSVHQLRLTCPEPYFVSEALYCLPEELDNTREVTLHVITMGKFITNPAEANEKFLKEVVRSRDAADPASKACVILMIGMIGERDIGECETCHSITGIPLFQFSRSFQVLVIKIDDCIAIQGEDGAVASKSFIEFYLKRPQHLEKVTLLEFSKKYNKGARNRLVVHRKNKIVQVYPKVTGQTDEANFEFLSKQQLMLQRSWRSEQDLKNENETWKSAFDRLGGFENRRIELVNSSSDSSDGGFESPGATDRDSSQ